jgi:hypothetical protein
MLIILLVIALQLPPVQRYITGKATAYLSKKIHTRVSIGEINLAFPKSLYLGDIYIEGLKHDTLFYTHKIKVSADMLGLLHKHIDVSSVLISGLNTHIERYMPDSSFNFSFIMQAFSDSTKPKTPKDTTKSKWKFGIYGLTLEDIKATYDDQVMGMNASLNLGKLDVDIRKFDLDKMDFGIKEVFLGNTLAIAKRTKVIQNKDTSTSKTNILLALDEVHLQNVHGAFNDIAGGSLIAADIGKLFVHPDKLDLTNQQLVIKDITLNNTKGIFALRKKTSNAIAKQQQKRPKDTSSKPWNVSLGKLAMQKDSLAFDNENAPRQLQGVDYSHLAVSNLTAAIENMAYMGANTHVSADIKQFTFFEKSGLHLKEFQGKATFDTTHAELADFSAKTDDSYLSKYLHISYRSLSAISKELSDMKVQVDMPQSAVNFQDVLLFQPNLKNTVPFKKNPHRTIVFTTHVSGRIGDMKINDLAMTTARSTVVRAYGTITGLPDANKTYFNITVPQLSTLLSDARQLAPDSTIPTSLNLPEHINATAFFKGYIHDFEAGMTTQTDLGNAVANIHMTEIKGPQQYSYVATVSTRSFNAGHLLKQDSTMGRVTVSAEVRGAGFKPEVMDNTFKIRVAQAELMKYPYSNISIDGGIRHQVVRAAVNIKDSNVMLDMKAMAGLTKRNPEYKLDLNIAGIDFQRLKFTSNDLRMKGIIKADFRGNDPDSLNGLLTLSNVIFTRDDKQYALQTLTLKDSSSPKANEIQLQSEIADIDFKGNINIDDIGQIMESHMSRYFALHGVKPAADTGLVQKFDFSINFKNTDLITEVFYPDLQKLMPGTITGHYNSRQKNLEVNVNLPEVQYVGIRLDSLKTVIKSDPKKLAYDLSFRKLKYQNYAVLNTSLYGNVKRDTITSTFESKDSNMVTKFRMPFTLKSATDVYQLSLLPKGTLLNYEPWAVSEGNYIRFDKEIFANHVDMSSKGRYISINTEGPAGSGAPMLVSFNNFQINSIASFINKQDSVINGVLNGSVKLHNIRTAFAFESDFKISNLSFERTVLGDLAIKADNMTANRYNALVTLSGQGNDVNINGYYTAGKASAMNFTLAINKFNVASATPFTVGQVENLGGTMTGELKLNGEMTAPAVTGNLHFNETGFTLHALNTHFTLHDEALVFNKQGIKFSNFALSDSLNNKAIVNGYIYTHYFTQFRFDLRATTDNFQVLNSHSKKDLNYYGRAVITSKVRVKGDINNPVVIASARLEKRSDFTIVIPEDQPALVEREGIVEFENIAHPPNPIVYRKKKADTAKNNVGFTGLTLRTDIEVNSAANVKIIVDPVAGDYLDVKGAGSFSYAINPQGKMTLTGRYEISEGVYQLTFYNYVKRKFSILQGSSIVWYGDPMDANLNIKASYRALAQVEPLMEAQLAGASPQQINQYRQMLNFDVLLNMSGALRKPSIQLGIELDQRDKGALNGTVETRLMELAQDQAEVNQQVFALLILNRFLPENALAGGGNSGNLAKSVVASSVSQIMGQALNSLAGKYVKNVTVNFDVQTYDDYTAGYQQEYTDVRVGVQKQMLDNRLTVQLGGDVNVNQNNVALESGQVGNNRNKQVVSDINVEYTVTKDGRVRLLFFRDNQYAGMLEGQIVETGTGVLYQRDFNKLKQLFKKPKNPDEAVPLGF